MTYYSTVLLETADIIMMQASDVSFKNFFIHGTNPV